MKSPTEFLRFFVVKTADPHPPTRKPTSTLYISAVGYGVFCNNGMTQSLIMCCFVLWLLIDVRYALDTQLIAFHQLYITNSVFDH
jgi:hypothetical protein